MRQHFIAVLLLIGLPACQHQQTDGTNPHPIPWLADHRWFQSAATPATPPISFLIVAGEQVGPIKEAATEASLIALLGAANVRRDTIYLVEGAFDIGTTLYKNTIDQAQILWADKRHFAHPQSVLLRPERDENNKLLASGTPRWITDQGLKIGLSLRAVEKLNGRAFALYGFGWDYGGLSAGWKGGRLEQKGGKTFIGLGFGVSDSLPDAQEKLYESLMGDQEFLSNNPAMQQLNPTIQNLTISFQ